MISTVSKGVSAVREQMSAASKQMSAASEQMSEASSAQRANECRELCGKSSGLKLQNRRVQFIERSLSYDRAREHSE